MNVSKNVLNFADFLKELSRLNDEENKKKKGIKRVSFKIAKTGKGENVILISGVKRLTELNLPYGWKLSGMTVKCDEVDCQTIVRQISDRLNLFVPIELIENVTHISEFARIE